MSVPTFFEARHRSMHAEPPVSYPWGDRIQSHIERFSSILGPEAIACATKCDFCPRWFAVGVRVHHRCAANAYEDRRCADRRAIWGCMDTLRQHERAAHPLEVVLRELDVEDLVKPRREGR